MTEKEFYNNIRTNILGGFTNNEGDTAVIYIEYLESDNKIIAGTVCNAGIVSIVSLPFDDSYTVDQHLETINEMLIGKGYFPM